MQELGTVLRIQRQCIHDGDGVRTVLFLKGCPLRCLWCANPESQRVVPEIGINPSLCIGDAACVEQCLTGAMTAPAILTRSVCTACGKCESVCFASAIKLYGRHMTVDEAEKELLKDAAFFKRNGGITISGGEPFSQPRFTIALLHRIHGRGIHTAVETCGYTAWENLREVEVDQFLFDIKHMNPVQHKALTGVGNDLILSNLKKLTLAERRITLRMPLIPGYNDTEENLSAIAVLMKEYGLHEFHLLPFHQLSEQKYKQLDQNYLFSGKPQATQTQTERAVQILRAFEIDALVGG